MPYLDTETEEILTYFRNIELNSDGLKQVAYNYINEGKIDEVINLCEDHDKDVDKAIREFYPLKHKVHNRPPKGKGKDLYYPEKIPRARQQYINDVETFFLLGNPIKWRKISGDDECFKMFLDFLREQRFDGKMHKVKELAGASTECAKLYRLHEEDGKPVCQSVILSRIDDENTTGGYQLRPLFDQYGELILFAFGYKLKDGKQTTQYWEIETGEARFICSRGKNKVDNGTPTDSPYTVTGFVNPTGKLNVVYYRQRKAWAGVEKRIAREEDIDSRLADMNNYFSDPIAAATADVVDSMMDPDMPGKLIQLMGDKSHFEYINPPQSSQTRDAEKQDLEKSILFDSYTPDLSFEAMRGMGTVSGAAMRNSMANAYIKRQRNIYIYEPLVDREKSLILNILKFLHPDKEKEFDELNIDFEFAEPFQSDRREEWQSITSLYQAELMSRETAIHELGYSEEPDDEIKRIEKEAKEKEPQEAEQSQPAQGELFPQEPEGGGESIPAPVENTPEPRPEGVGGVM